MNIKIEHRKRVVLITLDRPRALNALNSDVMEELISSMQELDKRQDIGCFVITGSKKAFAAGADIIEMSGKSFLDMYNEDYFSRWEAFANIRTPKIAAVAGYALGGGCELAMMCDIIYASDTAKFGQPEIKLGVIPGIGGTQRLTKAVGKYKAMDLILTGRLMGAIEAEQSGLVAKVFPDDRLVNEVLDIAKTISSYSKTTSMVAKETIDRALELSLREGVLYERRAFHSLFATEHQKEGMSAFTEKRAPDFHIPNEKEVSTSF
ncbi:enoyl-CoA hydratase [Aquimarina sp. AU474]|uniref:enoyl-CoA hydratase n=1 Tax=Aquimarina sp. AU474 TaxID=2108529 RepID=UPI000D68B50C|nr:enoyl-CoA hydratase [Aquimarina sp. AU474]